MSARTGRFNGTPDQAYTVTCDAGDCPLETVAIVLTIDSREWLSMCARHAHEETEVL